MFFTLFEGKTIGAKKLSLGRLQARRDLIVPIVGGSVYFASKNVSLRPKVAPSMRERIGCEEKC